VIGQQNANTAQSTERFNLLYFENVVTTIKRDIHRADIVSGFCLSVIHIVFKLGKHLAKGLLTGFPVTMLPCYILPVISSQWFFTADIRNERSNNTSCLSAIEKIILDELSVCTLLKLALSKVPVSSSPCSSVVVISLSLCQNNA